MKFKSTKQFVNYLFESHQNDKIISEGIGDWFRSKFGGGDTPVETPPPPDTEPYTMAGAAVPTPQPPLRGRAAIRADRAEKAARSVGSAAAAAVEAPRSPSVPAQAQAQDRNNEEKVAKILFKVALENVSRNISKKATDRTVQAIAQILNLQFVGKPFNDENYSYNSLYDILAEYTVFFKLATSQGSYGAIDPSKIGEIKQKFLDIAMSSSAYQSYSQHEDTKFLQDLIKDIADKIFGKGQIQSDTNTVQLNQQKKTIAEEFKSIISKLQVSLEDVQSYNQNDRIIAQKEIAAAFEDMKNKKTVKAFEKLYNYVWVTHGSPADITNASIIKQRTDPSTPPGRPLDIGINIDHEVRQIAQKINSANLPLQDHQIRKAYFREFTNILSTEDSKTIETKLKELLKKPVEEILKKYGENYESNYNPNRIYKEAYFDINRWQKMAGIKVLKG
jgi:hypothetical protein